MMDPHLKERLSERSIRFTLLCTFGIPNGKIPPTSKIHQHVITSFSDFKENLIYFIIFVEILAEISPNVVGI